MSNNNVYDLTSVRPKDTYQRVVQHVDGDYYDGLGNLLRLATKTYNSINGIEILDEMLLGDADGVNADFYTESDYIPNTTRLFIQGVRLRVNHDYLEVGKNQIVFLYPPFAGAELRCDYNIQETTFSFFNEELNGEKNDTNTVFFTSHNYLYNTTRVYLNGVKLRVGVDNDYLEVDNNQIVFNAPPWPGAVIVIDYKLMK